MSKLANMFSLLHVDGEDDREDDRAEVTQTSSTSIEETAASKPDKGVQNDTTVIGYNGGALASSAGGYRMPLVWIDLEMTGLDILKDRILEIACIITDGKLTKQIEGPDLVITQSKDCLDNMGEWCKTHHASSGLTERVLQSKISERDAEKQMSITTLDLQVNTVDDKRRRKKRKRTAAGFFVTVVAIIGHTYGRIRTREVDDFSEDEIVIKS